MPRKAVIGPEVVLAVEARTKQGMARAEAFRQIAAERGMKTSAVAANYYRTVRRDGASPSSSRRRTRRSSVGTRRATARRTGRSRRSATSGSADMNRLAADIVSAANALAAAAKSQAKEIVELRKRLEHARASLR